MTGRRARVLAVVLAASAGLVWLWWLAGSAPGLDPTVSQEDIDGRARLTPRQTRR